jgi:hypothetical protein
MFKSVDFAGHWVCVAILSFSFTVDYLKKQEKKEKGQ